MPLVVAGTQPVFRGSCSPIPSNNLLRAVLYADSSLTDQDVIDILNETPGMPTSRDFVEYTYYANGSRATMTDQRGVVHTRYDDYNAILNPDGWGGVATVWQENGGAVNTSTSPNVRYREGKGDGGRS